MSIFSELFAVQTENILIVCINWTVLNGDNTSKDEIFSELVSAVIIFKGSVAFMIYICCLIFDVR